MWGSERPARPSATSAGTALRSRPGATPWPRPPVSVRAQSERSSSAPCRPQPAAAFCPSAQKAETADVSSALPFIPFGGDVTTSGQANPAPGAICSWPIGALWGRDLNREAPPHAATCYK